MPDEPRLEGPLDLPASTCDRLVALRRLCGVEGPADLDVDQVRLVEMALNLRLSAAVLGLIAARIAWPEGQWRFELARMIGDTGAAHAAGARGDLVAVGRSGDGARFVCEEKDATRPGRIWLLGGTRGESERVNLDDWLDDQIRLLGGDPSAPPTPDPAFVPRIRRPPAEVPGGRRVRHATFGEGTVLQEVGEGPTRKLKVDFPGRGLKLLQAKFVEYLDS